MIVGAIVQLGRALGVETIAKGVEDAVVANMLLDRGCTIAQGFLFGKPVPPELFQPHGWATDHSSVFEARLDMQRAVP
jgi:EAL domain-containing protein (putative c-di-GMP-specific phosphodiesterase class I)